MHEALIQILDDAAAQGRSSLLEHEVYRFLQAAGCTVPRFFVLAPNEPPSADALRALGGDQVVVKVISERIAHKTDVGGVVLVPARPDAVRAAMQSMLEQIPARFAQWIARHHATHAATPASADPSDLAREVRASILGFMIVERVSLEGKGPGSELLVGLRHNREFGPVLTLGVGGVDTELLGAASKKGLAVVSASPILLDEHALLDVMRPTLAYRRLAGLTREARPLVQDDAIVDVLHAFRQIALALGSDGRSADSWTVTELEVNPFAAAAGRLVALDGLLKFRRSRELPPARPRDSLPSLLQPKSIAVIGVSTKALNMGRIILRNVLEAGFDHSHAYVVHPGAAELDGVRCVPTVRDLPERVDVFVLAVTAEQVADLMDEIVEHDRAVGVILITGGLGEKAGGETIEERIKGAVRRARGLARPFVINGGNSLGIVSRPGRYHTLFIPTNKLPLRADGKGNVAFLSQSGAYMISRMSKLAWLSPRYAVSTGNQVDLSVTDYLRYMTDDAALQTIAVYVEGFKDADGLAFASAARDAVSAGKDVVFYKAGRTTEGKSATSGHTASLAGEYDVCESIVRASGAFVARTFEEYLDLLKISSLLGAKQWSGRRLAAMSNAGYEAVGIADSVRGDGWDLRLASLRDDTRDRLREVLADGRLDALVDVRNPLDITPMANDQTHEDVVRAFLDDPEVDIVLCASVPLTPAMATLADGVPESQSILGTGSLPNRLARVLSSSAKPVAACIDSGLLFDPMARLLEESGVPTFRSADAAVRTLGLYADGRLRQRKAEQSR